MSPHSAQSLRLGALASAFVLAVSSVVVATMTTTASLAAEPDATTSQASPPTPSEPAASVAPDEVVGVAAAAEPDVPEPSTAVPDAARSSLELSATSVTVPCGGQGSVVASATIRDADGGVISGASVAMSAGGAPVTATTDDAGVATVTFRAATVGNMSVRATVLVDGTATDIDGSPTPVTFTMEPDCLTLGFTAAPTSADPVLADGQASWTGTMTLTNKAGEPVGGQRNGFNFNIVSPGPGFQVSAITDVGDGSYTVTMTATTAGDYDVTPSWNDVTGPTRTITFAALPQTLDPARSSVTATPTPGSSDCVDPPRVVADATVLDTAGQPIQGATVRFTFENLTASGTVSGTATTGSSGVAQASAPYRLGSQQTVAVTASVEVDGAPVPLSGSPAQAVVLAWTGCEMPTMSVTVMATNQTSIVYANGTDSYAVVIELKQANGDPLTGAASALSVTPSDTAVKVATITDNNDGTYTALLTSQQAGAYTVTAKWTGTGTSISTNPASVTFTQTPLPTPTPDGYTGRFSEGSAANTARVTVTDSNGNGVPGAQVTFTATGGATIGGATSSTVQTNDRGVAEVAFTPPAYECGQSFDYSVSATAVTATGTPVELSGGPITGTVRPPTGACATTTLGFEVAPTDYAPVLADGESSWTGTITLWNSSTGPMPGRAGEFSFNIASAIEIGPGGGDITIPPFDLSQVTDNGDGSYTVLMTTTGPGDYDVTVSWGSLTSPTRTVTFVPLPQLSSLVAVLSVSPTVVNLGGSCVTPPNSEPVTASVLVTDTNLNPVAGVPVTFLISDSAALGLPSGPVNTDTDGMASVTFTPQTVGETTVQARFLDSDGQTKIAQGGPATVLVTASVSDTFRLSLAVAPTSGSTPVYVGESWTGTIRLLDGCDVGLPGYGADLSFDVPADVRVSEVDDRGDGTYLVTFTSDVPLTGSVSASFQGWNVTSSPQTIVFSEAPVIVEPLPTVTVTASPSPVLVGTSTTLTITVTDANGTPVVGAQGELTLTGSARLSDSSSSDIAYIPLFTTNAQGQASFPLLDTKAETVTVTATLTNPEAARGATGSTQVVFLVPEPAPPIAVLELSAYRVLAGSSADATVTVTDANGNPIIGETVSFAADSSNVKYGSPGAPTGSCQTDNVGKCSVSFTSLVTGTFKVSATLSNNDVQVKDSPAQVTFWAYDEPQSTAVLSVSPTNVNLGDACGQPNGAAVTASVQVTDANLVGVAGVPVTFSVSSPWTSDPYQPVLTDASGMASITFVPQVAGGYEVDAVILDEYGNETVNVQGGPITVWAQSSGPDPARSTFTVAPSDGELPVYVGESWTGTVRLLDVCGVGVPGHGSDLVFGLPTDVTASAVNDNGDGTYTVTFTSNTAMTDAPVTAFLQSPGYPPIQIDTKPLTFESPTPTPSESPTPTPTPTASPTTQPTSPPPTTAPPTTAPPTSVPPTSVPPTTVPPTTVPPTSAPPTSVPPTSVPPTSVPPTTVPPTTAPPTSAPPTSATPTPCGTQTWGVEVSPSGTWVLADGQQSWTVTLTASGCGGPLPNENVSRIALAPSSSAVRLSEVRSNNDGTYTATATSLTPGSYTVSATVDGTAIGTRSISFAASAPDAPRSSLSVSATSVTIPCGGEASVVASVTVRDSAGGIMPGVPVTMSAGGSPVTTVSNGSGVATVTFRSTSVGPVSIRATIDVGGTATDVGNSPTTVTFVSAGQCATLGFTVAPTSTTPVQADGDASWTGTLTLRDRSGAPITGQASALTFAYPDAIRPTTVTDNGDGTYTVRFQAARAGTFEVTPSFQDVTGPTRTVTFVDRIVDAGRSSLRLSSTAVTATCAGAATVTATATVLSTTGRPVPGVAVTFTSQLPGSSTATQTATTGTSGVVTMTWNYQGITSARTVTFDAKIDVNGAATSVAGAPIQATITPQASCSPTSAPPTSVPPTSVPPTSAPVTSAPVTSAPPTSAPPTSAPPTSAPPTSAPPTSAPPTSAPPTSAPPTSVPPTSAPPTSAPPTSAPPTSAPPTSAPPTSVPPTSAPPTSAPPTSAPPTSAPPTSAPVTSVPPTSAPVTSAPPTPAPPTSAPPTSAPALPAPTVTKPTNGQVFTTGRFAFEGTSAAGATVTVAGASGVLCTAVVGSDGRWSCTPPSALAAGRHQVSVFATDATGTRSPQSQLTVVVGQTAATDTDPVGTGGTVVATPGWPVRGVLVAIVIWSIALAVLLSRRPAPSEGHLPPRP